MEPSIWTRMFAEFVWQLASHGSGLVFGALAIGVFGLGPIGRALARRIQAPADAALAGERQLEALRSQLAELQERADFSERLLTEIRQVQLGAPARADRIPPVAPSFERRLVTPVS
ncbi:MAG TPA: hypothetical protein PK948_04790 [Gemmatimonadales bacterium]|jgi:hypothetical protein|nr:hypothetical protein [Gemmatimonadales bacterium]